MVASPPIRIGFIGCGNIANSHMRAIECIPEIEIVAGADIKVDHAREFVEKAGAEAYFTDWRQMRRMHQQRQAKWGMLTVAIILISHDLRKALL